MKAVRFISRPIVTVSAVAGLTFYGLNSYNTSTIHLEVKKKLQQNSKYDISTPGLYIWGSNSSKVVNPESPDATIRTPYRLPYFDGKVLRSLALSDKTGVAVLDNGDLVQWGEQTADPKVLLKNKDLGKVILCKNGVAFALSKNGQQVYSWNTTGAYDESPSSSWWKFWSSSESDSDLPLISVPTMSTFESIKDLQAGEEHVVALTNKGRVFTGAAGDIQESKGQFGIASMSQFDSPPKQGELHDVKLIKRLSSPVEQIASGENHVLLRTGDGRVYGFGQNIYGQIATPFAQRTANIAVPTEIPLTKFFLSSNSSYYKVVTNIAAGGNVSYVTLGRKDDTARSEEECFSFGNGLSGQLGTGSFAHSQSSPLKLKFFDNLTEYSEKLKKMIQIPITQWSVGSTHTAVTLQSDATSDVYVWGGNQYSQLGNGRKSLISKPINILPLDKSREENTSRTSKDGEDGDFYYDPNGFLRLQLYQNQSLKFKTPDGKSKNVKVNQVFHAGDKVSAVYYTKA